MPRLERASGVLLHPTSLPGPFGIGDLGAGAYQLLDFLARADQTLWQVLPLTPTGYGNSPYAAPSAFAGNPLLVDLQPLLDQGLLFEPEVAGLRSLPTDRVAFEALIGLKRQALEAAHRRFRRDRGSHQWQQFTSFGEANAHWLDDFALFTALRESLARAWTEWPPEQRAGEPHARARARSELATAVEYHAFVQFQFSQQWQALRARAADLGVRVIGDIPIFVAHDSADVWAHQELFKLDRAGQPTVMAGVPPDYFSATGQLWGNPLYDWDVLARSGYAWWIDRFRHLLDKVDVVRIDHFRGFEAAWEVPAGAATAIEGAWIKGPGIELFQAVDGALGGAVPVVAEDLGLITDEVRALLRATGYPGMKVLQFAFGDGPGQPNPYLPHGYRDPNCVVYSGTHDNDTTRGWYTSASPAERAYVRSYLGKDGSPVAGGVDRDIPWDLVRLAFASVADWAIVPLQDVLGLGSEARMNTPGAAEGNWEWRVAAEELTSERADQLADLARVYGRARPGRYS